MYARLSFSFTSKRRLTMKSLTKLQIVSYCFIAMGITIIATHLIDKEIYQKPIIFTVAWAEDVAPEIIPYNINGEDSVYTEYISKDRQPTMYYHKLTIDPTNR